MAWMACSVNLTNMVSIPEIAAVPALHCAVIRFTIPRSRIRSAMESGVNELRAVIAEQGIRAIGPLFSHHFAIRPDVFDFEVGMPVQRPVKPTGRVQPLSVPPMKIVRSGYTGAYTGLGSAWGEFDTLVARSGYNTAPDVWESYVKGADSGLEPEEYYTELYRSVV